ncbi:MAG TPA: hypothetical protein VL495_00480 [Edaphobacter sp.]|nr:hypothetical protein [Edaphobacter sp.]
MSLTPSLFAADTCEANFKTSGDPRNGAFYSTSVTIPGIDNRSAIGQLEKIALDQKFQVGSEDYSGTVGTLIIIQKETIRHEGFPITITADKATGVISISTRLNRGQTAKPENIRMGMCSMLNQVKAGSEGEAIAAEARAKSHTDEVVDIKATDLGDKLRKDLPVTRGGNSESVMNTVSAKYVGRTYRIDGQVRTNNDPDTLVYGGSPRENFDVFFITKLEASDLGKAIFGDPYKRQVTVVCEVPASQKDYYHQLRSGDFATMTGKVKTLTADGMEIRMTLTDCMPATPPAK